MFVSASPDEDWSIETFEVGALGRVNKFGTKPSNPWNFSGYKLSKWMKMVTGIYATVV